MKDSPNAIAGFPDDFVSKDDAGLFAFISTLRVRVKAKVAADQERGLPLSEIVDQVREMVRAAGAGAQHAKPFPPSALPAITRQAMAWCVEAYRPAQLIPTPSAPTRVPTT